MSLSQKAKKGITVLGEVIDADYYGKLIASPQWRKIDYVRSTGDPLGSLGATM